MAAANDNITITVRNFRYKERQFTVSRNITIMTLQGLLFDEEDFLIFDEENSPYRRPSLFNIRLCIISDDHPPVIFNKLDRTLAQYNINDGDVINALMDPNEEYYNLNVMPPPLTLTAHHAYNPANFPMPGGKRSRRNRNRKTRSRRNRKTRNRK